MNDKIITVIGATGAQGGGLARAILNAPDAGFALRAVTRKPAAPPAQALAAAGAEVVTADLDDEASLRRAMDGAWGVFAVTNFWEHFSPEREFAQAGNIAAAARASGVQHVLWSTLEDTRERVPLDDPCMPTLMGRYKVPHFDAKGEANAIFRERGVPTTFVLTSFFWENLIRFGMGPAKDADGRLAFTLPMGDKKLPGIAVDNIGQCAFAIFRRGLAYVGKTVGLAGEHLTGAQMAAALSRALGQDIRYHDISPDAYRRLGFPGAEDLGNMFQFKRDFEAAFCGARDPAVARELNPAMQTFDEWLAQNKHRIPPG